jgi:hypothetical protein
MAAILTPDLERKHVRAGGHKDKRSPALSSVRVKRIPGELHHQDVRE